MPRTHFSGRTLSRSLALQLLFQAEATGRLVSDVLASDYTIDQRLMDGYDRELAARGFEGQEADEQVRDVEEYARKLALGADGMLHELDAVIADTSSNWSVRRMPSVDRNLLRIALYEMLCVNEVDTAIAIDECVELAHAYGTDDSFRFVNGLLGKVARRLEAGEDVVADALAALAAKEAARAEAEEKARAEAEEKARAEAEAEAGAEGATEEAAETEDATEDEDAAFSDDWGGSDWDDAGWDDYPADSDDDADDADASSDAGDYPDWAWE